MWQAYYVGRSVNEMLLKAEKILTHGDVLMDKSTDEIFDIVRRELCEKIVDGIISRNLLKIQIVNELHDDFGALLKVRVTTRVYNPDD